MPVVLNPYGIPLVDTETPVGSPEHIEGRAVIGYDSIFRRTDMVVVAHEEEDFPALNAFDDLTYDYWMTLEPFDSNSESGSDGDTDELYLTATFDEAVSCDYLAIGAHDLYSKNAIIDYQAWDPDTEEFVSVLPNGGFVPVSDSPFLITYDRVTSTIWRLRITSSMAVRIGVMFAGIAMPLQRFVRVGHVPATMNEELAFTTNQSEGGQFIGRSLVRKTNKSDLQLAWLTPRWVREHWQDFQVHARTLPFFFAWDTQDFPKEVIFGYADDEPKPRLMSNRLYMEVSIPMRGIA